MKFAITKNGKVVGYFRGTVDKAIDAVVGHFKIKGKYELTDSGYEILITKHKNVFGVHKT